MPAGRVPGRCRLHAEHPELPADGAAAGLPAVAGRGRAPPARRVPRGSVPARPVGSARRGLDLFVAYADAGAHVINLAAQGLPPAAAATSVAMFPMASYDTLPADSDTVLENYPCHPLGLADGCESANVDWPPTPCQSAHEKLRLHLPAASATGQRVPPSETRMRMSVKSPTHELGSCASWPTCTISLALRLANLPRVACRRGSYHT